MDSTGGNNRVKFGLSIEGYLEPDKVTELIQTISGLAINTDVTFRVIEETEIEAPTTLTKADLQSVWNSQGGAQAWSGLSRLTEFEGFPLRKVIDEEFNSHRIEGNIAEAIRWMEEKKPRLGPGSGSGVLMIILGRLASGSEDQTQSRFVAKQEVKS